jgi:hypothetical protein
MKKAHYRPPVGDYVIEAIEGGSIYIKPQAKGLKITAHPNAEALVTALLGEPNDEEPPDSQPYPSWRIWK